MTWAEFLSEGLDLVLKKLKESAVQELIG